jgi:hypothetical protein
MFIEEIANRLVAQNVGLVGSTIFLGSQAQIPTGNGPYISLIETGGSGAARMHNSALERPTLQVLTRGKSPSAVRSMSKAAYIALGGPDGLWNCTLDNIFYASLTVRQEPTDIGADEAGRGMFSFNIDAEKQRS